LSMCATSLSSYTAGESDHDDDARRLGHSRGWAHPRRLRQVAPRSCPAPQQQAYLRGSGRPFSGLLVCGITALATNVLGELTLAPAASSPSDPLTAEAGANGEPPGPWPAASAGRRRCPDWSRDEGPASRWILVVAAGTP
jgi:hypothetical protein